MKTSETTSTFADDIALCTMHLETRIERYATRVTLSWPMKLATVAMLVKKTGIDRELFSKNLTRGRIYLDMPIEIADAK